MESILEQPCLCPECGWEGTVATATPDIDGDGSLGCPLCAVCVEVQVGSGVRALIDALRQQLSRYDEQLKSIDEENHVLHMRLVASEKRVIVLQDAIGVLFRASDDDDETDVAIDNLAESLGVCLQCVQSEHEMRDE